MRIGGIDQWVSIRGNDARNPVLLMLHGGPGRVSMPSTWYFQCGWEEYLTVVQWDQRGAGRTYADNDPQAIAATMTTERRVADTEELAACHAAIAALLEDGRLPGARIAAPKREANGALVAHAWDPSGMLPHLAQRAP